MREKIIECLMTIGCATDENTDDLSDIITDSIIYVSFVIELEEHFEVEIPDEYLGIGMMDSISGIEDMIKELQLLAKGKESL